MPHADPATPRRVARRVALPATAWLTAGLALLTCLAAAMVLWLTWEVRRHERLALRQLRGEASRLRLEAARSVVAARLAEVAEKAASVSGSPTTRFAELTSGGEADGAIVFGPDGRAMYPAFSPPFPAPPLADPRWVPAREAEARGDSATAVRLAEAIADSPGLATEERLLARQMQARVAVRAGDADSADRAIEAGAAAASPAEWRLHALTLLLVAESEGAMAARAKLSLERLALDDTVDLSSPLRRLLLRQAGSSPSAASRLHREAVSSAALLAGLVTAPAPGIREAPLEGKVMLTVPDRSATLILDTRGLADRLRPALPLGILLVPPGTPEPEADEASIPAGAEMPGWRLIDTAPPPPPPGASRHLWAAGLSMAGLGALTLVTGRGLRRQLRRAQLREDLAATVSHELRTPLASMRLLVESLLEDDPPDPSRTREYLELMTRENQRLSRMVENFLTLARIERRGNPLDREVVPAAEIIRRTVEAAMATPAGPRLEASDATGLPVIEVPVESLVSAILNLIDNAAKFSPSDRPVRLTATADEGQLSFAVTDQGPGLTRAELARVWEPFTRGGGSSAPGCGLGLAIVAAVARRCGGRAGAHSTPGEGSTFFISVPHR